MNPLEKSVIATLSYFDIFDYPLTVMEIWKWLYVSSEPKVQGPKLLSLMDIQEILDNSVFLKERVESKYGFYFLKGREKIVAVRQERYSLAERKYHRALKFIRFLRFIPFIKMIAVCNTLAYNNSRQQADIDLFIIITKKRVWQARFWVTGILKLLGQRPVADRTQDKLCPSFFIDEDNLNIQNLALENDIYLPYWIAQVFPIYDQGVYDKFIDANDWVREKLTNFINIQPSARRKIKKAGFLKLLLSILCFLLPENLFKNYQMKIMPDKLKEMANKDNRVVINNHILKFHDNDRRQVFFEKWRERVEQVL